MAKILTWHDAWTLHIDVLDDDHRAIVELLCEIADRFCHGTQHPGEPDRDAGTSVDDCGEDLYAALDRFGALARAHFHREEELVRTIEYPGLPDHCREHALLMAEFASLVRELRERGARHLEDRDLEHLKQWVMAHVLGTDRRFSEYYFKICNGEEK